MNHVTIAHKRVTNEEIIAPTLLMSQLTPSKMNSLTISPRKKTTQSVWNDESIPLVSVLVHELRNPLTNIMLTIHLLESKILDDNDRVYMDIIKRSSAKINDLINDLLNGQKEEIQTEKHSIHQLLDEVIELAGDRLVLKNVIVKKSYAPYDLKVKMDKPKIKIALTNIIINAIDAMDSKNGELRLGTKIISGKCAVSIQDNGSGISKENLPLIFDPYFTNKQNGVGVGLAATKDILQTNKVGVRVESLIGHGTRFILLFGKNKTIAKIRNLKDHQHTIAGNRMPALIACEA